MCIFLKFLSQKIRSHACNKTGSLSGPESGEFPGSCLCPPNSPSPWQPANSQQDRTQWWPERGSWLLLWAELHHLRRKNSFYQYTQSTQINKCFIISKTGKQRVHFYALPISICSTASSTVTSGLETVFMNGYRLHTTTLEKGKQRKIFSYLKTFKHWSTIMNWGPSHFKCGCIFLAKQLLLTDPAVQAHYTAVLPASDKLKMEISSVGDTT